MLGHWKACLGQHWALLAILASQVVVYWTIALYRLGEAVPVAYQRF